MIRTQGLAYAYAGGPTLRFDDVTVPASAVLGGVEGQGFFQLMSDLPYERAIIGVTAAAAIEGALALTLSYTKERRAFGKPLFDFQNTRFKLAEIAASAKATRAFVDRCVEDQVAGKLDTVTASMVKMWATEQQGKVTDECLQLFGGYGYMAEYPIARLYADARIQRIYQHRLDSNLRAALRPLVPAASLASHAANIAALIDGAVHRGLMADGCAHALGRADCRHLHWAVRRHRHPGSHHPPWRYGRGPVH